MSAVYPFTPPKIAIVGGGLAGLVVLLTLHRRGVPATIYERDAEFNARAHLGGTLDLIWESGQRALRENGLQEAFEKNSRAEGDESRFYDSSLHLIFHERPDEVQDPKEIRPEIDRSVLRKLLFDACPADSIKWGHAFVSARPLGGGRHELTFANGTSTVCDLLIGADGAHSRVRPLVSPATPAYTGINGAEISLAPSVVAQPDMADVRAFIGHGTAFAAGGGKFMAAQLNGDGRVRTYVWHRAPETWTIPREPDEARRVLREIFEADGWHPMWLRLIDHCDDAAIYQRTLYHLPADHRWAHIAGVTLVGDAAHLMVPFAGEGANVAMLGGLELGLALSAVIAEEKTAGKLEKAVQAYEETMFEVGGKMAAFSRGNMEAFMHPDAPRYAIEKLQGPWNPSENKGELNKSSF